MQQNTLARVMYWTWTLPTHTSSFSTSSSSTSGTTCAGADGARSPFHIDAHDSNAARVSCAVKRCEVFKVRRRRMIWLVLSDTVPVLQRYGQLINRPEVAGVIFLDSDPAPVPKCSNLDPGPNIYQIWESDSCSDSGYNHRSNRNSPMFLLQKWPHRLLPLPKLKRDSGSRFCFSQIFNSRSERKTQNPAGVDSGTPDPWPPLQQTWRKTFRNKGDDQMKRWWGTVAAVIVITCTGLTCQVKVKICFNALSFNGGSDAVFCHQFEGLIKNKLCFTNILLQLSLLIVELP